LTTRQASRRFDGRAGFYYLEQEDDKIIADFSNRTSLEALALIGADGGVSAVSNIVFGGQNASYTGHVALRTLVPFTRVPRAIIEDPYVLYVGAGPVVDPLSAAA
jgi:2-polyprenyl-6-methoxyphenol hydroxylase-like FAD-dependent oxidoreductase